MGRKWIGGYPVKRKKVCLKCEKFFARFKCNKSFRTKRLEAKRNAMTVNGEHRQARTERGILRCLARMLFVKIRS